MTQRSGLARLRELVLDRIERSPCPAGKPELAQDVRHVRPGGALADEECARDVLVRHALTEQAQDVLLAIRERLDRLRLCLLLAHAPREETGDRGVERDFARVRLANGARD